MLKTINKYIKDNEFYINICNDYININNFIEIVILEDNKVVLNSINKKITIKGNNISINRLLDNEILLKGEFYSIELGDIKC